MSHSRDTMDIIKVIERIKVLHQESINELTKVQYFLSNRLEEDELIKKVYSHYMSPTPPTLPQTQDLLKITS